MDFALTLLIGALGTIIAYTSTRLSNSNNQYEDTLSSDMRFSLGIGVFSFIGSWIALLLIQ